MSMLENLMRDEIAGKNKAIHAYDGMLWKIRSGFLTLLFAGWAVLLKSIVDSPKRQTAEMLYLLLAMFIFSLGLASGGWFLDRTYLRRKFRVILALDGVMAAVHTYSEKGGAIDPKLLAVAGDKAEMPYQCAGYREAFRDSLCVFVVPLVAVALAAGVIIGPWTAQ